MEESVMSIYDQEIKKELIDNFDLGLEEVM
jgi:hypothetical protein